MTARTIPTCDTWQGDRGWGRRGRRRESGRVTDWQTDGETDGVSSTWQ